MRKIWDIPGGIHPPENKHRSLDQGIGQLPLPKQLILPLNQHIGAPAKPVVNVGDPVLKGQLIAEAGGFVSAAIHAPTSGTVTDICDHPVPHPSGMTTTCIIIEPDGNDTWIEHRGLANFERAEIEILHDQVRAAGITGLGGAGFPTAVKLSPLKPISTLIINGTECEPYITADDALMQAKAEEIIHGVNILRRILGNPKQVLIGVEDNKPRAFEALEAAAKDTNFEVIEFPTKYPSGGEKQLIQILTGKEVPANKLPAELGIVLQNVGTAYAVYNAVAHGEPLISRITTVTGNACSTNRNYEVLLGTPVNHLLEHSGFDEGACTRLVMGGPMMGFTLPNADVPVIKSTNCLLACDQVESPLKPVPQQPCIRCGMCAEACPASLLPQQLYWYGQAKEYEKAEAYNLFDCIECGACAYVCPSNIPLVQYYRATKGEIRKLNVEKKKSDHARKRFEFHQQRLEKAEAEKAAKREARRQAALDAQNKAAQVEKTSTDSPATSSADSGSAQNLIQAAMAKAAARKASPEHQKAKLERGVEAAKNRLKFAEEKLADATDDSVTAEQLEALRAKVEEAKHKLGDAEKKLANESAEPVTAVAPATGTASADNTDGADKIAAKIQASPRHLLDTKIAGIKQRIATTEAKVAETTQDSVKFALLKGLEKQQSKLADAENELTALSDEGDKPVEDAPALDAAAAAIARAQAKAKVMTDMTPAEKITTNIESLTKRIAKAEDKLAQARTDNSEHIDTLATALEKLNEKLIQSRLELEALNAAEAKS